MSNGTTALLRLSQLAQALALTRENVKVSISKKKPKIVKQAVKNVVGIELIKAQGKIIGTI